VYIAPYTNAIFHSTGNGTWTQEVLTSGWTFQGIWGAGPNDVYTYPIDLYSTGNGTWTPITISTTEVIMNIWGSSATDVYAVGDLMTLYHKNSNGTWSGQNPGWTSPLWMSGSSASDLYVITAQQVFHSRGDGSWTPQSPSLQSAENMTTIWALSPTATYATTTGGAVLRSGGDGVWVKQLLLPTNTSFTVNGIWGTSPNNLYVVTDIGVYHGIAP